MSLNGGGGCTSAFPSPLVSAAGALVLFGSSAYASLFLSSSLGRQRSGRRNNGGIGRLGSNSQVTKVQTKNEPHVSDVEDLGISSCGSGSIGCNDNKSRLPDYGATPVEVDKIKLAKVKRYRRRDLDGRTLVDQTLTEMENDPAFQETARRLKEKGGAKKMSLEERKNRRRALDKLGVPNFKLFVAQQKRRKDSVDSPASADGVISRKVSEVLQLNIGLYCNQACNHCHVESSPKRVNEMMSEEVAARCLELLANSPEVRTLDLTGGAPELNRSFRFLVEGARKLRPDPADLDIIDRCNLTVLHEPNQGDLVDFLVGKRVHVVASLPCYSEKNVNTQRGGGVFDRSISALLMLNEAGYGTGSPDLQLDLVYNPLGAFLPPPQGKLKEQYKLRLEDDFGVTFDELYTMTNMPIKRFADFLHKRNELEDYMDLLVRNFNLDTVDNLMCRNTVSVGYDGKIFDCDFNQQLGLSLGANGMVHQQGGMTVFDVEKLSDLRKYAIQTDNHCFGCTAGMGSS